MSLRGEQWKTFSEKVLNHIEKYSIFQYGDRGKDLVSEWSSNTCKDSISKYVKRFNTNSRKNQEYLDLIKIAHYCCLAHDKMKKERKPTSFIKKFANFLRRLKNDSKK